MLTRSQQKQLSNVTARHRLGLATRPKNATQRPGKILLDMKHRRRPSIKAPHRQRSRKSRAQAYAKHSTFNADLSNPQAPLNLPSLQSPTICSTQVLTLEQIAQLCLSGMPPPPAPQPQVVAASVDTSMPSSIGPPLLATGHQLMMPFPNPSKWVLLLVDLSV